MDLNQFLEWQRKKKGRSVTIELGEPEDHRYIRVWAYDYNMGIGQVIRNASEIDLEAKKAQEELEELARLQKK